MDAHGTRGVFRGRQGIAGAAFAAAYNRGCYCLHLPTVSGADRHRYTAALPLLLPPLLLIAPVREAGGAARGS